MEPDATEIRPLLIRDPYNVELRKRYLALRTPDLLEEDQADEGLVRTHLQAMKKIPIGLLQGAGVGVVVWALSWVVVALGWVPEENDKSRGAQGFLFLRMFANQLGLVVSVIAFALTTGLFVWHLALKQKQRARMALEFGPLPAAEFDGLAHARRQLLRE